MLNMHYTLLRHAPSTCTNKLRPTARTSGTPHSYDPHSHPPCPAGAHSPEQLAEEVGQQGAAQVQPLYPWTGREMVWFEGGVVG